MFAEDQKGQVDEVLKKNNSWKLSFYSVGLLHFFFFWTMVCFHGTILLFSWWKTHLSAGDGEQQRTQTNKRPQWQVAAGVDGWPRQIKSNHHLSRRRLKLHLGNYGRDGSHRLWWDAVSEPVQINELPQEATLNLETIKQLFCIEPLPSVHVTDLDLRHRRRDGIRGRDDRCSGEGRRSASTDHTVTEIPSLVNFSTWLKHRSGSGRDFLQYLLCLLRVWSRGITSPRRFIFFMQNGNKIAFSQQSVLTVQILPGFLGRKVLTLCALAIWDVSGLLSCLAGVNLQNAAICLSFDPCGKCVIYSAVRKKNGKNLFFVATASRQTTWSNRHWTKL